MARPCRCAASLRLAERGRPNICKVSDLARIFTCQLGYDRFVKLTISKDDQCLFITAVANHRLPVFKTDAIKKVTCEAIDEARRSCGFLLFAYVVMPDHFHVLTDSPRKPSIVLQFIKGIVSHRVLEYLKDNGYESSLRKLEHQEWKRNHRYSLWQHDSDAFAVTSETTFMQKVNYIHQNPVSWNGRTS
jgi:putative transposase